jgi:molecular chaperone DnaK
LKDAHKSQNLSEIDSATAELNSAWTTASEEMYKASQGQPQGDGQANAGGEPQGAESNAGGDNVTDAEFEEVK